MTIEEFELHLHLLGYKVHRYLEYPDVKGKSANYFREFTYTGSSPDTLEKESKPHTVVVNLTRKHVNLHYNSFHFAGPKWKLSFEDALRAIDDI